MRYTATRAGTRMAIHVDAEAGDTITPEEQRAWGQAAAEAGATGLATSPHQLTAVVGRTQATPLITLARRVCHTRRR